jgi:tetratricopeptide (TPR) repeat protein
MVGFESRTSTQSALPPGEILCERFRVVRFLARGGVGEVYEAEDLALRSLVALKALRPEIATDSQALERFRREILLGRQVTHPNVCRIFDLFQHRREPQGSDVVFITMELLRGQNLAERIRSGPLSAAEALPLLCQMASGLDAAHRAGIVHRDFKSANVMLVPSATEGLRAVITDFGLARSFEPLESSGPTVSGSGGFVGTCAYMAPEQVEGKNVAQAADIYAFGIVMYEMLTGKRPFAAGSVLATALQRLKEPPVSPRTWLPDLPPRWEAVILSCLEREPDHRPARAGAIIEALSAEERNVSPWHPRAWAGRWTSALAGVVVLLGMGPILRRPAIEFASSGVSFPVQAHSRRSVVVLGFRNLSEQAETAWLSTALSETLGMELAVGEKYRLVPGEDVARSKMELRLRETDGLAKDTLQKLRLQLGADLVVLGSYLDMGKAGGGRVRFDLRVQDVASGEQMASIIEEGTEEQVLDLVSRMGARLRDRLGVSDLRLNETSGRPGLSLPANQEALRLFSEGVARLRDLDALEARKLLERAVAADGSYFPARVALSEAWSLLGYERKALDEAKQATKLAADAPREQRLWVEGHAHEAAQQWDKAVDVYRLLQRLFPDDLDYGLRLGLAQTRAGQTREALGTFQVLRRLPGPAAGDPRIDLGEADAQASLGDHNAMQMAAHRAAEKGSARGAALIAARSLVTESRALQELGQVEEAARLLEQARDTYQRIGDQSSLARVATAMGLARWQSGDVGGGEAMLREALALFERMGNQRGVAVASGTLASMVWKQGLLDEVERLQEQSLRCFREINDRQGVARVLIGQAVVLRDRGELDRAQAMWEETLRVEEPNRRDRAVALSNLGTVLQERGDLEGARKRFEEALAANEQAGVRTNAAVNHQYLGVLFSIMGRLDDARREQTAGLELRQALGEKLYVSESRLGLATLALEEGRAQEAEQAAREIAASFRELKATDHLVLADAVLARALADQGRLLDAREAIVGAANRARKSQVERVRLWVAICEARYRAAPGPAERPWAVKSLQRTLEQTRKEGRLGLELEARLALAEIGLQSGRGTAAGELEALEKEASARGYALLARKAAAARRRQVADLQPAPKR